MRYASILTYVDGDGASEDRLNAAIETARQFDAHLSVMAVGYDFNVPAYAFPGTGGAVMSDLVDQAKADARERADEANAAIGRAGILGDAEPVICRPAMLIREMAARAKFADLVVVMRPYGQDRPETAGEAFEAALIDGEAPVLVFPPGMSEAKATRVLIGWNFSHQALKAARAALPFLDRAEQTEIVMFDSNPPEAAPGQRLATMLSRHGVSCEILLQPESSDPVSSDLMRRAEELGAGLIVLGGYGHSRLREYIVGGATRDIVSESNLPVLLAH